MTSFACFELLRRESARVKAWTAARTGTPCTTIPSAERGKMWSGNFHHDGRTAFQVRHRKADHEGEGTGHGLMVLESANCNRTRLILYSHHN